MTQPPDTIEAALADHLDRTTAPAWFTQTVERTFKVGDRVRVRISPESRVTEDVCERVRDQPGVVTCVGSRYMGTFRFFVDGDWFEGWMAAAELEPVDPAPEARPSGATAEGV
jgi:hypothetical protein